MERIQRAKEILRVHFEILHSNLNSEVSEKKEESEKGENEKMEEEEWIDIYDGEGWGRYAKTGKR